MKIAALIAPLALVLSACPQPASVQPYDSCSSGDDCSGGLACVSTTLPASTGFTGYLCTSTCSQDSDCVQVPSSFAANCINSQCYLTCPSNDACPYDQSCLTFSDQNGNPISLCSP